MQESKQHGLVQITVMPCPFTGPKMFWAGPIFLCQTNARQKDDLHSVKLVFLLAQKFLKRH